MKLPHQPRARLLDGREVSVRGLARVSAGEVPAAAPARHRNPFLDDVQAAAKAVREWCRPLFQDD